MYFMGGLGPDASSRGQRTLIRLGSCPGLSDSSLGTHVTLLDLSSCGSNILAKECILQILRPKLGTVNSVSGEKITYSFEIVCPVRGV